MITIDYILLAVALISAVVGLFRGFVKEALSLVTWGVAVWLAAKFGAAAGAGLPQVVDSQIVQLWLGRAVVLVAILIAGGLLGWLLSYLADKTGLTGTDRMTGMIFGMGRGVLLGGLMVIILQSTGFDQESWWADSKLIPYAAPVAEVLRDAAASGIEKWQEGSANDQT